MIGTFVLFNCFPTIKILFYSVLTTICDERQLSKEKRFRKRDGTGSEDFG
jgi:hypothetical protein